MADLEYERRLGQDTKRKDQGAWDRKSRPVPGLTIVVSSHTATDVIKTYGPIAPAAYQRLASYVQHAAENNEHQLNQKFPNKAVSLRE